MERPWVVRGLMLVAVVAVSFAAVLIRVASAPALALAFWRTAGGTLALLPFAARRPAVTASERLRLVVSGLFLACHFTLFIAAFDYTSVASAALFVSLSPLFVGAGAALFLREPPTRRAWLGMGLATAGAVVIGLADAQYATGPNPLLGDALAVTAAVAVAGYLLLGQDARQRMDVATYGAWVYGTATVVLFAAGLLAGVPLGSFDAVTWWAIVGLVVGPQLLGHTLFNQLLSAVSATTVATVVLSEPVLASLLALLLLGEEPGALLVLGAPFLLAGVYLVTTAARPVRDRVLRPPVPPAP